MKFAVVLVLVGAVCALAQDEGNSTEVPAYNPMGDAMIFMQVQQEEMMAKKYLDIMLKMQHSQFTSIASSMFMQMLALEYAEEKGDRSLEESNTLFSENTNSGFGEDVDTNTKQMKLDLLASYYLLHATRVKFLQTVYKASDVQREFWMDRALMMQIQTVAAGLPPQILQLVYFKLYRTNLETIKLAMAFQYLSHFVTWLEDAIDVNAAVLDENNPNSDAVAEDQADDLIRDKQYAFTAFNTYATLDFQVFYMDLYLESMMGAGAPPAPPQNETAFLETEAEAEPSQFIPAMYAAGNPMAFMKIYKMYFLMFQMYAASSALGSTYSEKLAYEKEAEGESADEYRRFAQQQFGGMFAHNLLQASQIEHLVAIYEMWMMYAPMYAAAGQGGAF